MGKVDGGGARSHGASCLKKTEAGRMGSGGGVGKKRIHRSCVALGTWLIRDKKGSPIEKSKKEVGLVL